MTAILRYVRPGLVLPSPGSPPYDLVDFSCARSWLGSAFWSVVFSDSPGLTGGRALIRTAEHGANI